MCDRAWVHTNVVSYFPRMLNQAYFWQGKLETRVFGTAAFGEKATNSRIVDIAAVGAKRSE